ncbi:hypothetical protein J2W95_000513 [Flavobacterium granuli]|uniref:Uncharacterized protein n=1 Tax=Flavobacterium granuli TaxID=280093 RepID=A0ABU1RYJ0_9FLAO|nr:hypothetical protein [Flavobacterium granuli]
MQVGFFYSKKLIKKVTKSIEIITFAQNLQKTPLI